MIIPLYLAEHMETEHGQVLALEDEPKYASWREFDFLLVSSGRGHKEKNMMAILFDFHWNIIIEHCVEIIGFRSPKQKILLQKTKDHHLSFDLIKVIAEAIDEEIAYHTIKELKSQGFSSAPSNLNHMTSLCLRNWSEKNQNMKYMALVLRKNLKAIIIHHLGVRLNRPDLIYAGEAEFSKLYFLNMNLPYCTITAADYYQSKCLSKEQREDIEAREGILKNSDNLTTGESMDYIFEGQNKILMHNMPPNAEFDDFRKATLTKEEAEEISKVIKELYSPRSNENKESGFPDYSGCVSKVREVLRLFVGDPNEEKVFTNLKGDKLNKDILRFDSVAKLRRKDFFEEILSHGKFTKAPHKHKKIEALEEGLEDKLRRIEEIVTHIEDSEEKLNVVSKLRKLPKNETEMAYEVDKILQELLFDM